MCIRRHVTLVYPLYPSLFTFQSEHNLEASCLLTLLVWARRWGEHCFVYFGKSFMNVRVPQHLHSTYCSELQFTINKNNKLSFTVSSKSIRLVTFLSRKIILCIQCLSLKYRPQHGGWRWEPLIAQVPACKSKAIPPLHGGLKLSKITKKNNHVP